jgi:magnesium-transporting ATPase (P-type)
LFSTFAGAGVRYTWNGSSSLQENAIVFLIVIGLFVLFALWSQRKLAAERGLVPIYETWCGGLRKFGVAISAGTAIPIWRISLYADFFVLAAVTTKLIYYSDVVKVEYQQKSFFNRIEIQARKPEFSIILYLRSPKKLAEIFQSKGILVLGLS